MVADDGWGDGGVAIPDSPAQDSPQGVLDWPAFPLSDTRGRRTLSALALALNGGATGRGLRYSALSIATLARCSEATVRDDWKRSDVIAQARAATLAGLGAVLLASLRAGLTLHATRAAAGDLDSMRFLLDAVSRCGVAGALLDPVAAAALDGVESLPPGVGDVFATPAAAGALAELLAKIGAEADG